MDGDLIQLIDEDDDDQLLEVPLSEPAASAPEPSPSAAQASTPSQPPPASASDAEAGGGVRQSQPPSYSEANRCEPSRPVHGCLRIGLLSITILFAVISLICVTFSMVGIVYCSHFANVGHGIWTPVMVTTAAVQND